MGRLTRSLAVPPASTLSRAVTDAGVGGLGPFYGVMANPPTITLTNASTTTIASGTRFPIVGSALFKVTAPPIMSWTAVDASYMVVGNGVTTDITCFVVYEFLSTAPQVELKMLRYNSNFTVRVDGELIRDTTFQTDSAGSGLLVKMDWSADANPTKQRLYRVAGFNMPFSGLWVTSGGAITYPTARDSVPLLAFFGDSYTQGTGANGPDRVYGNTLATALGYDYWGDGLGSSGWNTASPNTPVERINKRIAVMARTPAAIVTALGYNDAGGNMTNLATNYDATIALLQSEFPGIPIISLGPWTPVGTTANLDTVASTISGRAAAGGVDFVSIADIITAANKATYTGGDNVHPTQDGHNYLGRTIAARVRPHLP